MSPYCRLYSNPNIDTSGTATTLKKYHDRDSSKDFQIFYFISTVPVYGTFLPRICRYECT